jgi:hypothetical protein
MSVLTRIKNNQIFDKTIDANAKIVDRSIRGPQLNEDLTLTSEVGIYGNTIIHGNLTVTNSYIVTTTVNTNINDPLVIFNSGFIGSPTYDIGILVNRNLQATSPTNYGGLNAAWIWREDGDRFEGILTSETGTSAGSINRTAYANLVIGNTIITTTAGEVVDSTSTGSGALQVVGGVGITANLNVGSTNDNWNTVLGNSYFGTSTLTYPSGNQSATQQAVENIKTFTGSAFNLALINSDAAAHATFTQNTAAQGGQLSIVTYQSGNDINLSPNGIFALSLAAANGSVIVQPTTDSQADGSYTTGAFISQGGVAVQGNVNVAGASTFNGVLVKGIYSASANFESLIIGANIVTSGLNASGVTVVGQYAARGTVGANATIIGTQSAKTGAGAGTTMVGSETGTYGTPGINNTFIGYKAGAYATTIDKNIFLGYNAGSLVVTNENMILGSFDGNNNPYYDLNISDRGTNNIIVADGTGNVRVWIDQAGTTRIVSNTIATHGDPTTGAMAIVGGLSVLGNIQVGGNAITIANGLVIGGNTASAGGTIYIGGNVKTASLGANSVVIGNQAGGSGSGANVTIVGDQAGVYNPGANDVFVGRGAGLSHTGVNSTFIGTLSGKNTTGDDNQFFGYNSGSLVTTGTKNVILGAYDGNVFASLSNRVMISDGAGEPRVYIDNKGGVQVLSTEESTSDYGALRVEGGVSIAKKLHVGGNVVVTGNLFVMDTISYVNSDVVAITDPIILLNTGPNGAVLGTSVNFDVGVRARHWYNGASRDAFFGRIDSSDEWEFYANVTSESGNVIAGTIGNLRAGGIHLSNAYNAIDKTGTRGRGAITTLGGASIALDLYVGGQTYNSGQTNTGNYSQTGGSTTFILTGTDTVTIAPATAAQVSTIDNMAIGQSTPNNGKFSNLVVSGDGSGYNMTIQGSGFANIAPTGAVKINPGSLNGQDSNMDNVFIGNTVPRDANITQANISYSLTLRSFTANSVLFIGPNGNLAVDQKNQEFNFQRTTGNTYTGVNFSVGTNNDFNGTDTFNIYYQGDAYLAQSATAANTTGQTAGWTVSSSRGTGHAPAISQDGDFVGLFGAYNYSGTSPAWQEAAAWRYVTQGTNAAATGIGGQAQLWTKRDDSVSTLALRVDAAQVATFYGQVIIANNTGLSSTLNNSSDGSLYVFGAAGIQGNIVSNSGARINDSQKVNNDFIVRGYNDGKLLWARTRNSYDQVLIGNTSVDTDAIDGAKLQIFSNDSMLIPRGDSSTRPAVATAGMMRFNYTTSDLEYYNGIEWFGPSSSAASLLYQNTFLGNGVQQNFTLSNVCTSNSAWVSVNGVIQIPGNTYSYIVNTVNGVSTLQFNEAPAIGDVVDVRIVTIPSEFRGVYSLNLLVSFDALDQNFGANISTGTPDVGTANTQVSVTNTGSIVYYGMGNILVGTGTATLHSFEAARYRSAKYYVQVSNHALGEYESSEIMLTHNGTTAYSTQYARIYTGASSLGTVGVTLSSGNVSLQFTGVNAGNYVKVRAEYMTGYN